MRDSFGFVGISMLLMITVAGCVDSTVAEGREEKERKAQFSPPDPAALNAVLVQAAPVRDVAFQGRVALTGIAKPLKKATVAAEIPGQLVKNRCTTGHKVRKNEIIYQADTSDIRLQIRQAKETLAARRTDAAFSDREFTRAEELVRGDVQPEQALTKSRYDRDRTRHNVDAAETALSLAQKALRDASIRAPFSGTIARCLAEKGDYVRPGTPLFELIDLSEVRLEVGVPAALAAALHMNAHARAEFEDLRGAVRDAVLIETSPSPTRASGTYPARFSVENSDGAVLEGMTAGIVIEGEPRQVLAVPREAVLRIDGEPRVYIVSNGRAVERPVRLGAAENGAIEILEGLKSGELVVVDGMFALTDGRPVMVERREEEE